MESLREKIARLTAEDVEVVPYDAAWPARFEAEKRHLLACLGPDLVVRVEHMGSTAVPGLSAKPIVDILVEVRDLEAAKRLVVPTLEAQGYEYVWRPTTGDDGPPFYAWFIKRDAATGARTHHIHMIEAENPAFDVHRDRLTFRDHLIAYPEVAREYDALKRRLATKFPRDRVAYTNGKSEFISAVMERLHAE